MKPFFAVLFVALCLTVLIVSNATLTPGASMKGVLASSSGGHRDASSPGFSLAVSQASIPLGAGGPAQKLTIAAFPVGGLTGPITVEAETLPAGVTVYPANFTVAAGSLYTISVSASSASKIGDATIRLRGKQGANAAEAEFAVSVRGLASAALSTRFFDFGGNLTRHSLTSKVVSISNKGTEPLSMSPTISGDPSFAIVAAKSCRAQLAPAGKCSMVVEYRPTIASMPNAQAALLDMHFANVAEGTPETVALRGTSAELPAGVVTRTENPQVALYTMTLPFPGRMRVSFGTTDSYGRSTWFQSTDTAGGQVKIYVAGMLEKTTYHMRASLEFGKRVVGYDQDHTFTTGAPTNPDPLKLEVSATAGMTPQPGLELVNSPNAVVVTDLAGNPLWTYVNPQPVAQSVIEGTRLIANGNVVLTFAAPEQAGTTTPTAEGAIREIREVTLGGATVKEISIDDLNAELSTASCAECKVRLMSFHDEVTPLPNGHWLVLASSPTDLSPTTTPTLTNGKPQPVLGDVIVDLDEDLRPVWAWNEFNHLDPNRQPMGFPGWTHMNAVVYSPDDGNILVSVGHQNWVLKVNYADGNGNGDILWRLGEGGDFMLLGGTDPTDWNYAQKTLSFASKKTAGVFSLAMMDGGDGRILPEGVTCGTASAASCHSAGVRVFQIDENAKTATLTFHEKLDPALHGRRGGNAEQLANGDIEYAGCGMNQGSVVREVTQAGNPATVWQMNVTNADLYRAFRIPSFYPGVQW